VIKIYISELPIVIRRRAPKRFAGLQECGTALLFAAVLVVFAGLARSDTVTTFTLKSFKGDGLSTVARGQVQVAKGNAFDPAESLTEDESWTLSAGWFAKPRLEIKDFNPRNTGNTYTGVDQLKVGWSTILHFVSTDPHPNVDPEHVSPGGINQKLSRPKSGRIGQLFKRVLRGKEIHEPTSGRPEDRIHRDKAFLEALLVVGDVDQPIVSQPLQGTEYRFELEHTGNNIARARAEDGPSLHLTPSGLEFAFLDPSSFTMSFGDAGATFAVAGTSDRAGDPVTPISLSNGVDSAVLENGSYTAFSSDPESGVFDEPIGPFNWLLDTDQGDGNPYSMLALSAAEFSVDSFDDGNGYAQLSAVADSVDFASIDDADPFLHELAAAGGVAEDIMVRILWPIDAEGTPLVFSGDAASDGEDRTIELIVAGAIVPEPSTLFMAMAAFVVLVTFNSRFARFVSHA